MCDETDVKRERDGCIQEIYRRCSGAAGCVASRMQSKYRMTWCLLATVAEGIVMRGAQLRELEKDEVMYELSCFDLVGLIDFVSRCRPACNGNTNSFKV